jgi:hypothetical protein
MLTGIHRLPAMQEDLQRHLFGIQEALDRLPEEIPDPVKTANEIIWKFSEKLRAAVNIYHFKTPLLVGTCRRRLEEFTDILYYRLSPQFRPFPKAMEGSGRAFEGFPETLPPPPAPSEDITVIAVPGTVYLDEVMKGCDM